jgi:hypothetical protein
MLGEEIHQQSVPQIQTHNPERGQTERAVKNPSKCNVYYRTKKIR